MKFILGIFLGCIIATYASPRISGGKDAADGKYPYMVSVRWISNSHICGGSIINKRWILTAAQCVYHKKPETLKVVVGTNLLKGGDGQTYQPDQAIPYKYWNDPPSTGDIGLIRVNKDIEFNDKVQPVKLPTEDFNKLGHPTVLTGWGSSRMQGPYPNNLQELTVKVIDQKLCQEKYGKDTEISESHICSFTKEGEGLCMGDGGSPLVVDGVQVGIASFNILCGSEYPDVYTRIYTFLDWIAEQQAKF